MGERDKASNITRTFSASLLSGIVGAILGATATITTAGFGYLNKDREMDIQMVEIGLSILNGAVADDSKEDSKPARAFAVSLLERYADVEISYREEWIESGNVPYESPNPGTIRSLLEDLPSPTRRVTPEQLQGYQLCLAPLDPSDPDFDDKADECSRRFDVFSIRNQ